MACSECGFPHEYRGIYCPQCGDARILPEEKAFVYQVRYWDEGITFSTLPNVYSTKEKALAAYKEAAEEELLDPEDEYEIAKLEIL